MNKEFDQLKSQKEEEEKDAIKYLNEIELNLEKNINTIKVFKNEVFMNASKKIVNILIYKKYFILIINQKDLTLFNK